MASKTRVRKPIAPHEPGTPYTPEEVAAILRVSVETVGGLCRNGQLVAMKIGSRGRGLWRIEEADLAAFREQAKVKPAPVIEDESMPKLRYLKPQSR